MRLMKKLLVHFFNFSLRDNHPRKRTFKNKLYYSSNFNKSIEIESLMSYSYDNAHDIVSIVARDMFPQPWNRQTQSTGAATSLRNIAHLCGWCLNPIERYDSSKVTNKTKEQHNVCKTKNTRTLKNQTESSHGGNWNYSIVYRRLSISLFKSYES